MKVILFLIALLGLILCDDQFTRFTYHNGDEILRKLQEIDDKTYVLFVYNDPGNNRDLRTTNDYFRDRLRTEILAPEDGTKTGYIYAEVDATDMYGNGYLVDRLNIDKDSLNEKPTIVVMKNGQGNVIRGPTALHSVATSLQALEKGEAE